MDALEHAKETHGRWSQANRRFLELVERHPRYQRWETFEPFHRVAPFPGNMPLSSWPFFVSDERHREIGEMTVGLDALFRSVLDRFFDRDPARIAEFYDPFPFEMNEEVAAFLLSEPSGIETAPARGDFIETADGLRCIEYNAGSGLGGWQVPIADALVLEQPVVRRFAEESGIRPRPSPTIRALFRHFAEVAIDGGVWTGGDLNVAVVIHPHDPDEVNIHSREVYTDELRAALDEDGRAPGGRVFLCSFDDLVEEGGALVCEGQRVHAVFEQHDGDGDSRRIGWYAKAGRVDLHSGYIGFLLSDKRNVALLSEHAASDRFCDRERRTIEHFIPWTRRVGPERADELVRDRESRVLKKAMSMGGADVSIGPYESEEGWRRAVERAVAEGDWIVQEYLQPLPYYFPDPEDGVAPHDSAWGFFAFGGSYAGIYFRLLPRRRSSGVINASLGSNVAVILDTEV